MSDTKSRALAKAAVELTVARLAATVYRTTKPRYGSSIDESADRAVAIARAIIRASQRVEK